MAAVHQLIPTFVQGDGTGHSALHLQLLLRRLGVWGELYAADFPRPFSSRVRPAAALAPQPDDLVLYHHGIGSPLAGRLMHLPCRKGLVFHNISPTRFYTGTSLHEELRSGRAQLAALAPWVDVALADSDFNGAELRVAGYRNVHTVPLFVEPERFAVKRAEARMARALRWRGPTVLSVSRVMPHKRFEDLLALHEELLRLEPDARLLLVGSHEAGSPYFKALSRRARGLRNVSFLGRLSHGQLVAAYRSAQAFVSMSEHEGFGVPFLEAMAAELPVLAFSAAAVPETLGGRGIVFTEKRFAALAELLREVFHDGALRTRLLAGQAERLRELSAQTAQARLESALQTVGEVLPAAQPSRSRRVQAPANLRKRLPVRPKVAFVVQRYGDVSGGAELLARQLAQHLVEGWDITVLTTCAKDHLSWENVFPAGPDKDGRVKVLRFPTVRPRRLHAFNALSARVLGGTSAPTQDRLTEEHWVAEQGPLSPALLKHLAQEAATFDGFVFFTYLYATTVWGLPLVAKRALLVSTAHDEAPIRLPIYDELFESPHGLICLTPEELAFVDARFPKHAPAQVISVGLDFPDANAERFRKKHALAKPYLFYVGRVEAGKGIGELLDFHAALVRAYHDAPDLVLAGAASMEVSGQGVRALGRISDQDKFDGLAGALAAVAPSRYESLSLLTLESFAQGTPVLANGHSEVLAGQLSRSGGGRTYVDRNSFIQGVKEIGETRASLGRKALAFAHQHTWEGVVDAYRRELSAIMASGQKESERRARG